MERVSDEELESIINMAKKMYLANVASALTELRERRAAEKAPCPEHEKMVAEWYAPGE